MPEKEAATVGHLFSMQACECEHRHRHEHVSTLPFLGKQNYTFHEETHPSFDVREEQVTGGGIEVCKDDDNDRKFSSDTA